MKGKAVDRRLQGRGSGRRSPVRPLVAIRCSVVLLLLLAAVLPGCGKKKVKPPSPEAEIAREAMRLAEALREAYLGKERAALEALCTRKGYLALIGGMKEFDSAELEFRPKWVEIKDGRVMLHLQWKGRWVQGGNVTRKKGLVILAMTGRPLRLDGILRANPFREPEL